MADIRIAAQPRDPRQLSGRALRRAGLVPGIYYTRDGKVRWLQFEKVALDNLLRKEVGLLCVDVDGESLDCIIREVQRHPVRRDILHVDLMGIVRGQKIRAHVPIHPVGIAAGIKEGGLIELVLREVEVECEPARLPTHFDVDVTHLKINDHVRISDLQYEGIVIHGDPQATVVHVIPPRKVVEEVPAVPAEEKEPEVIRERKGEAEEEGKEKEKEREKEK
jgi:large subunit ribosomal protein L25